MSIVEHVWYGSGKRAAVMRAALWPLSRAYELAGAVRGQLYDRGKIRVETPALPAVSVGNLTVGGTGKTPFAAWIAAQLGRNANPAIVLRGYGGDEHEVHRRLNPEIPVIVNADRAAAIRTAKAQGADVVVLDDAFQHRRVGRTADILLLSVEQLMRPLRLLPAGPWREPLAAAGRADLLALTRKSAGPADAERAAGKLRRLMPGLPVVTAHLALDALVSATDDETLPLGQLRNASVTAIAAIGEPGVFARQLEQLGARVSLAAFRDHHAFSAREIRALAARVPEDAFAVCTLKDVVKLADRWPASSRLWYVSQRLVVEQGEEDLNRLLTRVLEARATTESTAG